MDLEGLAPAGPALSRAFARGLRPPRRRSVAEWAQEERYVSRESGSPMPGKWSNDYVPEMVEVMECLSPRHPARQVVLKKSAQTAGTETGINKIGHTIQDDPAPMLVVLPTTDEVKKYVKIKLQPTIDATPAMASRVRELKSRDETSSTTTFKKFEGGFLQIAGANSSAGLQMISVRDLILEEVSEYPFDVDGRGDPVDLAIQRTQAWEGREKIAFISTPGLKGMCRVSIRYEQSDKRLRYLPCPQCDVYQPLFWENLDRDAVHPFYKCAAHGCAIEEGAKWAMRRSGVWVKTFTDDGKPFVKTLELEELQALGDRVRGEVLMDGRQPGFAINALYSSTKSWTTIVKEWRDAQHDDAKMKVFTQQVLGEEWETRGDAPDHEKLFDRRAKYEWRRVPVGALFITGAADVQKDRIEWAIYCWGAGFTSWLIDKGVLEGDPNSVEIWRELTKIFERSWDDSFGRPWRVDAFGVDCGYLSQSCYRWVRQHVTTGRVFALDGRPGWKLPALGTPSKKDVDYEGRKIGAVLLWPVGNWGLKSELYSAIGKLMQGADKETGLYPPGTAFYGDACDSVYLQQLTAEQVIERRARSGAIELVWDVIVGRRNEAHDIAVYARALAHHMADGMSPEQWLTLASERGARPEDVQRDLARLWASSAGPQTVETQAPAPAPSTERPQTNEDGGYFGRRGDFWK